VTVAVVSCDRCGGRFNYVYVPGVSFRAVRGPGGRRSFRCPLCDQRASFPLGTTSSDPRLPTFEDPVGAREFASGGMFLAGTAVLVTVPISGVSPPDALTAGTFGLALLIAGLALLANGLIRGRMVGLTPPAAPASTPTG
jgi:hypothetical protein